MKRTLLLPVSLLLAVFAAAAAVPPPDQLLPDDTLVAVTIPDFTKALSLYTNSPQVQLWNDPAMKPFRDKFMDKLRSQYITPLEHDLGIRLDDYTSLPQGQLTFAMVEDEWQGTSDDAKPPGLLFLLDTKDKSAQLKTNLTNLKKKWLDAGRSVKTEKIRDVEFSAITLSSNDIPEALKKAGAGQTDGADSGDKPADGDKPAVAPSEAKTVVYIGQADSLLIVGNSTKDIEKVLAANAGGSVRTLSQVPDFAANRDSMLRDAPFYGWVNAHAFVDILKSSLAGASPGDDSSGKMVTALGLDGLRSIAFSYLCSSDGSQFNLLVGAPEESRAGIFKILAGEPKDCTPPGFVPADTVKFQRWRIDGQKVWDGLRTIVGNISPQMLGGVDFMLSSAETKAKEKDPDFEFKKNLFANIGDDFITYQKSPKGGSAAEMAAPPTLYLIGSPHPEQLAGALNALMVLVSQDATPDSRDFLGRKIYSVSLGGPLAQSSGTNLILNYASSGGYLAMTTDTPILEEYLRSGDGEGHPLRETPGLAAATEKVTGPDTSLFGYSNESETVRLLFDFLKKDSSGGMSTLAPLAMAMGIGDGGMKDWFDTSLLPDFSQISKYFTFSVYGGSATPDGLAIKAFAPVPPQLNK